MTCHNWALTAETKTYHLESADKVAPRKLLTFLSLHHNKWSFYLSSQVTHTQSIYSHSTRSQICRCLNLPTSNIYSKRELPIIEHVKLKILYLSTGLVGLNHIVSDFKLQLKSHWFFLIKISGFNNFLIEKKNEQIKAVW